MLESIKNKEVTQTVQLESIISRMTEKLCDLLDSNKVPTVLVVAIKLPTGAIEIIQNTQEIPSKVKYYHDMYTATGKHKNCADICMVDFLLV